MVQRLDIRLILLEVFELEVERLWLVSYCLVLLDSRRNFLLTFNRLRSASVFSRLPL
jgi:hypothetical protein